MLELGDEFTDLLVALHDEEVEFLLVGGWAMALHGSLETDPPITCAIMAKTPGEPFALCFVDAMPAPVHSWPPTANLMPRETGLAGGIRKQSWVCLRESSAPTAGTDRGAQPRPR